MYVVYVQENVMEKIENSGSTRSRSNKGLLYSAIMVAILGLTNPKDLNGQNFNNSSNEKIEQVVNYDILEAIQQRINVELPVWYEEKLRNFVNQSDLLKDRELVKYTEDFIVKKMNEDLWITKKNQLLFLWNDCISVLLGEDLYPWYLEDDNDERAREFKKALPFLRNSLYEYSERTTQRIITLIYITLNELAQFYNFVKEDPQSVDQADIDKAKWRFEKIVPLCNAYNIDYTKRLSSAEELYGPYL